jgi:hypothetical protein
MLEAIKPRTPCPTQIPPDFVVKCQAIDIIGEKVSSKHHVETGNRGMSRSHHRRPTDLPLKTMECEK